MKGIYKFILGVSILVMLFLVNYMPHHNQMPQHVDSWFQIAWADKTLDDDEITCQVPFIDYCNSYPPGTRTIIAAFKEITGLELFQATQILPGIIFVLLGLLLYLISNYLFKNDLAALSVMAMTPLVFSNITILGPFYLAAMTFGILFALLCVYFLLKENYVMSLIMFLIVLLTHKSSTLFLLLWIGFLMVFNRKYWSKAIASFFALVLMVAALIIKYGFRGIYKVFLSIMLNTKEHPFISLKLRLPILLFFLLGLGFYFIYVREKKARNALVPMILFLALNVFIYWNWQGLFIPYRRMFVFLFLFFPFFVGYALFLVGDVIEKFLSDTFSKMKKLFKNVSYIVVALLVIGSLFLFIPLNMEWHRKNLVYVNNVEHELLTEFANQHPDEFLATHYLVSYALPVYDLKPIHLCSQHVTPALYFREMSPCFLSSDTTCLARVFYSKIDLEYNLHYIYTGGQINSPFFKPYFEVNGKTIYEFDRAEYEKYLVEKKNEKENPINNTTED